MAIAGMSEEQRLESLASALGEMEALALRIRELVSAQSPRDLLGYIYAQPVLAATQKPDAGTVGKEELINMQFLLEYVHAVLASTPHADELTLDEEACAELFDLCEKLRNAAMLYAMFSSSGTADGDFGPNTADVEFRAKSAWILLRGNRYQVLEGEFYAYVLAPHDAVLHEVYGIGSEEVAMGFQMLANAVRTGHASASEALFKQIEAAQAFVESRGATLGDLGAEWLKEHPDEGKAAGAALDDLLRGGVCNVSRHTKLPETILADLAYERGEDNEFFAEGEYSGTPYRTLPARKKPLIKLGEDYYAVDPSFTRDAGYRALLWNLLRRKPEYRREFEFRQKAMSEAAFFEILADQVKGAKIFQEVYYKDPATNQWAENDTLVIVDDVLILVEAKAGAAATISSPANDFPRHVRSVQDLVIKAFEQCDRFFRYVASAEEVPIYKLENGKHVEVGRLRASDYRLKIPIGLTVESFAPFSTMCKELPDIVPILGEHPFISVSIDDLFVIKRFLPTMGELAHYLSVRQHMAGMKNAHMFDELDHLGAYIKKNRFDLNIADQLVKDKPPDLVLWDGMGEVVDEYFSGPDWEDQPVPSQGFPDEVEALLSALDKTRAPGWLFAESLIRDFDEQGRTNLGKLFADLRSSLTEHPHRYFLLSGESLLFIWMERAGSPHDVSAMNEKASAVALAVRVSAMVGLHLVADASTNGYVSATPFRVEVPEQLTTTNAHVYEDAKRINERKQQIGKSGTQRSMDNALLDWRARWSGVYLNFKGILKGWLDRMRAP